MGALASAVGIPVTIAIGGALSLVTGIAALAWYQSMRSGVPSTSAAFRPPNPNEVVSTRR
jgi:hypothetical protein